MGFAVDDTWAESSDCVVDTRKGVGLDVNGIGMFCNRENERGRDSSDGGLDNNGSRATESEDGVADCI